MSERATALLAGLGAGLAVTVPAVLAAQILDAVLEDGLPAWLTAALSGVALAGPLVGGAAVARRRPGRHRVGAAAVGLAVLGLVAALGTTRRSVAGDDAPLGAVPALMVVGAALGLLGGALGAWRAGRTRP